MRSEEDIESSEGEEGDDGFRRAIGFGNREVPDVIDRIHKVFDRIIIERLDGGDHNSGDTLDAEVRLGPPLAEEEESRQERRSRKQ